MGERSRGVVTLALDSLLTLSARPWRSLAMVAGVMLGVASSVTALLLADTQQAQIDKRFDAQRASVAVLQTERGGGGQFDPDGLAQLRAFAPVSAAGELSIWRERVTLTSASLSRPTDATLLGAEPSILAALGTSGTAGRDLAALGGADAMTVIWLGHLVPLGVPDDTAVGSTVRIGQATYTIGGIVRAPPGYAYVNTAVIMSPAAAEHDFGAATNKRILIKVRPGSAAVVAAYAADVLDARGRFGLKNVTPPDGRILLSNVARDLRSIGLALGSLIGLIGIISIANTLSMAVYQRSRELGLRAAMGWSRTRIAALIIAESMIAGALASVLGCFVGILLAAGWSLAHGWELIVEPLLPVTAIPVGVLASVLGGLVPALRAAGISPLEAMRS